MYLDAVMMLMNHVINPDAHMLMVSKAVDSPYHRFPSQPATAPPAAAVAAGKGKGFAPWAGGKGGKPGRWVDAWGGEYVEGGYVDVAGTFWPYAQRT